MDRNHNLEFYLIEAPWFEDDARLADIVLPICTKFELLVAGNTAAPIAEKLFLSVPTVKSHIYNIYKKMDIHSQNELIEIVERS